MAATSLSATPRPRIGQQRLVQGDLGAARLAHRRELRPQQIAAQEVVANAQAPIVVDGEETVPAGGPEIGHGRTIACGRAGGRTRLVQPPSSAFFRSAWTGLSPSQIRVSA